MSLFTRPEAAVVNEETRQSKDDVDYTLLADATMPMAMTSMGESSGYWSGSNSQPFSREVSCGSASGNDCRRPVCIAERTSLRQELDSLRRQRESDRARLAVLGRDMSTTVGTQYSERELQARLEQETEQNRRQAEKMHQLQQEKAAQDEELAAYRRSLSALRNESAELKRELQEEKNAHRDARNNYGVLQQEKARIAQQLRYLANPVPERNELIREPRGNWVPGCEKYGIGVDEPG
eukprot:scpid68446/ scgid9635/ 